MLTISTKLLKAICEFASKDEDCRNLNGVNFECAPGASTRVNITATDGATMVIANVARAGGDEFAPRIVPLADLMLACRVAGTTGCVALSFADDRSTELAAHDKSGKQLASNTASHPIGGSFPEYMNVLPSPGEVAGFGIDTRYLARLFGIASALGVANNAAKLVASGPMDPARFDVRSPEAGGVDASVVIMPVRYDGAAINWQRH